MLTSIYVGSFDSLYRLNEDKRKEEKRRAEKRIRISPLLGYLYVSNFCLLNSFDIQTNSIPSLRSNQQPALSLPVKKRSHEPPPLPVLMIPKRVQRTQSSKSFQVKKNYQHHHYHNPAQLRAQQKRTIVVLNTVIVIPIMGNKLDKIEPGTGRKICPEEFGVENKIGLAYCVLHHAPSDITSDEVEKYSHHGLAIDINGLSNDEMFRAAHFDLYVRGPTDYSTYVEYNYKERKWTDYALVQPIGRIPSSVIQQYGMPHYYAEYVEWILTYQVHRPMAMIRNMNAADAFDIGNFNEDDTKEIKLTEADQELYKNFPIVISER
ncbi:unnamed protein product [Rotaria sp. Silwood1]|nr:unnamed protein product [Rotaria sp. Silwood1]